MSDQSDVGRAIAESREYVAYAASSIHVDRRAMAGRTSVLLNELDRLTRELREAREETTRLRIEIEEREKLREEQSLALQETAAAYTEASAEVADLRAKLAARDAEWTKALGTSLGPNGEGVTPEWMAKAMADINRDREARIAELKRENDRLRAKHSEDCGCSPYDAGCPHRWRP